MNTIIMGSITKILPAMTMDTELAPSSPMLENWNKPYATVAHEGIYSIGI